MIYKSVNSKEIIARIQNDFNVDYSGWLGRLPQWVDDCLKDIEVYPYLEYRQKCIDVYDYKLHLPCDAELIEAVKYKGQRMDRTNVINHRNDCDLEQVHRMQDNKFNVFTYEVDNDDWLSFSFPEGQVTIYYRSSPYEFDEVTKIYYPLIPDNQKLKLAIEMYCIKMMLSRGHKHPVFDLDSRNEATNPYIQYEKILKKEARNSLGTMDKDGREQVSKQVRTLLSNKYWRFNEIFDNTGVLSTTATNVTGSI